MQFADLFGQLRILRTVRSRRNKTIELRKIEPHKFFMMAPEAMKEVIARTEAAIEEQARTGQITDNPLLDVLKQAAEETFKSRGYEQETTDKAAWEAAVAQLDPYRHTIYTLHRRRGWPYWLIADVVQVDKKLMLHAMSQTYSEITERAKGTFDASKESFPCPFTPDITAKLLLEDIDATMHTRIANYVAGKNSCTRAE